VVYTRHASGVARIYINNGEQMSGTVSGGLSNWDAGFRLALASEFRGNRPWLGDFHRFSTILSMGHTNKSAS
jgi:hypothetical protein